MKMREKSKDLSSPEHLWQDVVKRDAEEKAKNTTVNWLQDGLVLSIFRLTWWPSHSIYQRLFAEDVDHVSKDWLMKYRKLLETREQAEGLHRLCVDIYVVKWTIILAASYFAWFNMARRLFMTPEIKEYEAVIILPFMLILNLFPLLRLYELWAFIGGLHSQSTYKPGNVQCAILGTVWHYVEAIIAFSIIFVTVSCFAQDSFYDYYGDCE